jgi:hypothetical protein
MDNSLTSYFGMKGLIDLRVADILAKQSALHHKAAMEQLQIANKLMGESGRFVFYAEKQESGGSSGPASSPDVSLPTSAYVTAIHKPKFLPLRIAMQTIGINPVLAFPLRVQNGKINNFI